MPKRLRPGHLLERVLGKPDAERMVRMFGGEILKPGNCKRIAQGYYDAAIAASLAEGLRHSTIAAMFGVTTRTVSTHAKRLSVAA